MNDNLQHFFPLVAQYWVNNLRACSLSPLFSQFSTFSSKIEQYAIAVAPYFNCKPRPLEVSKTDGNINDAHHQATCHVFNTIPHIFTQFCITVVVRILVALGDNLVSLLFPAWTSRMRRVRVVQSRYFIPLGGALFNHFVLRYFGSIILFTKARSAGPPGLIPCPQMSSVTLTFFLVARRYKAIYPLLNFLLKGSDIFAACSSSGGQELEVIQRKSGESRARMRKRIAQAVVQVRCVQVD